MRTTDIKTASGGIYSYGEVHPAPPASQFTLDVKNWRDPMGNRDYRTLNGTDRAVQLFLMEDPRIDALLDSAVFSVMDFLNGGCKWISIGVRDYHGILIAPGIAELVAMTLDARVPDFTYHIRHYGLELPVKGQSTYGGRAL